MLQRSEFDAFVPDPDPYAGVVAEIFLDDVPQKDENEDIKLSILMSTYHRVSQLRRSLECLARQDWKEFEVLICDDGDDNDLSEIYAEFEPYLHLRHVRRERDYFHVDPTGGFLALLPLAKGEIVAIMQPEIMLHSSAARILYYAHFDELPDCTRYMIDDDETYNGIWVALKVLFMSPSTQRVIDSVDWHNDVDAIQELPAFWTEGCGLGGQTNKQWSEATEFPWWFIGSAPKDDPIFRDMVEFLSHASIDFYLIGYRTVHQYLDIVPYKPLGYHQDHHRFSIGFFGEQDQVAKYVEESKNGTFD